MNNEPNTLIADTRPGPNPTSWFSPAPTAERLTTLQEKAAAYVRQHAGQFGSASTVELKLAGIRKAATVVTKASRTQHHEAIALAYAIFLANREGPDFAELIAGLAQSAGLRVTKATDPLAVIVASLITYGGGADPAASSKLRSRDVQAIRYLVRKLIAPSSVAAEAAKKGEGLDTWARRTAAKGRTNAPRGKAPRWHAHSWKVPGRGRFRLQSTVAVDDARLPLLELAIRLVTA